MTSPKHRDQPLLRKEKILNYLEGEEFVNRGWLTYRQVSETTGISPTRLSQRVSQVAPPIDSVLTLTKFRGRSTRATRLMGPELVKKITVDWQTKPRCRERKSSFRSSLENQYKSNTCTLTRAVEDHYVPLIEIAIAVDSPPYALLLDMDGSIMQTEPDDFRYVTNAPRLNPFISPRLSKVICDRHPSVFTKPVGLAAETHVTFNWKYTIVDNQITIEDLS